MANSRRITVHLAIALLAVFVCLTAAGQGADVVITRDASPSPDSFTLATVASGFNRPIYATHAGDGSGRLFLLEQSGKVWILRDGARDAMPFLDVSTIISRSALGTGFTEQGLLGLAFHSDHADNGVFFINYTDLNGDTVVARYATIPNQPDLADPGSGQIVFELPQPFDNHNGGHIEFGPDGYLYIALGDGGGGSDPLGAGQNRRMLLGSMLRIDVDSALPYAIPPDNPFVNDADSLDEIWAYGLRNVWRFSFDRATGDMYLADVGQDRWEEINFQPADSRGGENYGWNAYEGDNLFAGGDAPNYVPPIADYKRALGCSVTGGLVYRGGAISDFQGVYLFGDFCSGRIWGAWRDSGFAWRTTELRHTNMEISSFGEDEAGEVYVIDYAGTLYRVAPSV